MRRLFPLCLGLFLLKHAFASVVFQDGFESGVLGPAWTVSSTNDGRAQVTSNFAPASGQAHLVLDDAVNDGIYSVAEATLALDLTNKKNVVLSFQAKSLGNDPDNMPQGNFTGFRTYDGVAISVDGGTTWRGVQSLASLGTSWQAFSITLDSAVASLGGSFRNGVLIRFSEYDNSSAPLDGIAIDDVTVTADPDQRLIVELPGPIIEGTGGQTGLVELTIPMDVPLTVNFTPNPTGQITIPSSVTIPAGETLVSFPVAALDNNAVDLTRTVTVTATAAGLAPASGTLAIYDDDAPIISLQLPPQLTEGDPTTHLGTLILDRPATVPLTVFLSATPANELVMSNSVTIPAGQTQATFSVAAQDDNRIDGNVSVAVTASAAGLGSAIAQTTTIDNELRALSFPSFITVQEGAPGTATVKISGILTVPLTVYLTSADPSSLNVPATTTIEAGSLTAIFPIIAIDNTIRDGSRSVTITASAPSFTDSSTPVVIRDNEVVAYRLTPVPDYVNLSSSLALTISALDIEGNVVAAPGMTVQLNLILPDGTAQALTPASVTLQDATGWTGNVVLPQLTASPLRIRIGDASGNTAETNLFDVMRVLPLHVNDILWDQYRQRFYMSVRADAGAPYANNIIAVDPVTLQVTAHVANNQEPGQLALSQAGDALYAAFRNNGTIARIDPDTMTITNSFTLGTDSTYGAMWASDFFVLPGSSNTLVVSLSAINSNTHAGVAAYDNGLMRPNRTVAGGLNQGIEPSSDPSILFALDPQSSNYPLRKLRLDSTGVSQITTVPTVNPLFQNDIRSDGNFVFTTAGISMDGAQMARLGAFGVTGLVCPELAASRVYFLEQTFPSASTYDKVGSYDPVSFGNVRRLKLPSIVSYSSSFVRWGKDGLAFYTPDSVYILNTSQVVPSEPAADLSVVVQANPRPASVGGLLTYNVQVTNAGPNPARSTVLKATLSSYQTIQSVIATSPAATPNISGLVITVPIGDLAVGQSTTLTITTLPQSPGSVSCNATVSSASFDTTFANNTALCPVSVQFPSGNAVNQLRLTANNLVYDSVRNLLWASIPSTVAAPFGGSVVSIDPLTGVISDPIPLNGSPTKGCMAISKNGRYLYVGIAAVAEVRRIDLQLVPYSVTTILLGVDQTGASGIALDLEVLDGDGTSFIVASWNHEVGVFDGSVRRATFTNAFVTVNRLAATASPNVFVTYNAYDSGPRLNKLSVSPSGATIVGPTISQPIYRVDDDIANSGNWILVNNGSLIDASTMTVAKSLGVAGRPCVDAGNGRAYLVNGTAVRAFDLSSGASVGALPLPTTLAGDWSQQCLRWGPDGFAILGTDLLYVARWGSAIPDGVDQNSDRISDSWEANYFGTLAVNVSADADGDGISNALEYLFATSPIAANSSPLQTTVTTANEQSYIHLAFPRRADLAAQTYGFEVSSDLKQWMPAQGVIETVLSTQTTNGIQTQTIDAAIPVQATSCAFARLKWLGP